MNSTSEAVTDMSLQFEQLTAGDRLIAQLYMSAQAALATLTLLTWSPVYHDFVGAELDQKVSAGYEAIQQVIELTTDALQERG